MISAIVVFANAPLKGLRVIHRSGGPTKCTPYRNTCFLSFEIPYRTPISSSTTTTAVRKGDMCGCGRTRRYVVRRHGFEQGQRQGEPGTADQGTPGDVLHSGVVSISR